jgi:hypothetical protein
VNLSYILELCILLLKWSMCQSRQSLMIACMKNLNKFLIDSISVEKLLGNGVIACIFIFILYKLENLPFGVFSMFFWTL